MNDPIIRQLLARQVADRLQAEISAGRWADRLPGTRTLAERYGVNRMTCVAAMELLERRGLPGRGGDLHQPPCKPAAATKAVARSRRRHNKSPNMNILFSHIIFQTK